MKYTFTIDWANKNEQFQNYCNFLLKLGFQEKVRGMVLQAMRIIEDEQSLEDLKDANQKIVLSNKEVEKLKALLLEYDINIKDEKIYLLNV